MSIDISKVTKSHALAIRDNFLNYFALKAVHDHYIPEGADDVGDYYINQVLIPDKILKEFPRTRLFTGENDPLCDD